MRKILCVIFVLMLAATFMAGCADKTPKEHSEYFLTSAQETEMENSIENFLKARGLFEQGYTGVHVRSGSRTLLGKEVVDEEKTRIIIFVPDDIAGNISEATVLNDGYSSAMELYFGADGREEYDVVFQVIDDDNKTIFEFVNEEYCKDNDANGILNA